MFPERFLHFMIGWWITA